MKVRLPSQNSFCLTIKSNNYNKTFGKMISIINLKREPEKSSGKYLRILKMKLYLNIEVFTLAYYM